MKKESIIPVFIPHIGCPHQCVFCNQKKISGQKDFILPDELESYVIKYSKYFKEKEDIQLAFYGGSFTAIDPLLRQSYLKKGYELCTKGLIAALRYSTRPDAINDEILSESWNFGVRTIELGVQSLDEYVLETSGRGHNSKVVYDSFYKLREYPFKIGLQQMIGLPRDSKNKSIKTAMEISNLKPEFVRIYPTLIIEETPLKEMYEQGKYLPLSLQDAVEVSESCYRIYTKNKILVIRMGLQPSEEINYNSQVIGGPFHPSFGQLVKTEYLTNSILEVVKSCSKIKHITISSNKALISNLIGQKGFGKKKLETYLNATITYRENENLKDIEINIEGNIFQIKV